MAYTMLDDHEILDLIQNTKSFTRREIRGTEFTCCWEMINDSGTSELWYIYREDNTGEFAYAVDWSDPKKYPENEGYFFVDTGEWLT